MDGRRHDLRGRHAYVQPLGAPSSRRPLEPSCPATSIPPSTTHRQAPASTTNAGETKSVLSSFRDWAASTASAWRWRGHTEAPPEDATDRREYILQFQSAKPPQAHIQSHHDRRSHYQTDSISNQIRLRFVSLSSYLKRRAELLQLASGAIYPRCDPDPKQLGGQCCLWSGRSGKAGERLGWTISGYLPGSQPRWEYVVASISVFRREEGDPGEARGCSREPWRVGDWCGLE
jgi:hypothetical protein